MDSKPLKDLQESIDKLDRLQEDLEGSSRWRSNTLITMAIVLAGIAAVVPMFFFNDTQTGDKPDDKLQKQVQQLQSEISAINAKLSASENNDVKVLSGQLGNLETKVQNLETTILADPDKAITSRLLREEQKHLQDDVASLKADNAATRQYVMTLILAVIAVPLATGLFERFRKPKQ